MDGPCVITGSFIISFQELLLTLVHVDFKLYVVRFRLEIKWKLNDFLKAMYRWQWPSG